MGQEIEDAHFKKQDFKRFINRLKQETELLGRMFEEQRFANDKTIGGFELEAWLIDDQFLPAPVNAKFIETINNPLVSPELANFNIEFNFTPQVMQGDALKTIHSEMNHLWQKGRDAAHALGCELAMVGILPTLDDSHLTMEHISGLNRYRALNEQVLRLRKGRPIEMNIHGHDVLKMSSMDVMFESATTSFQIHFQVPIELAVRTYNASVIASAPMVAVCANSPYLCGKDLWAETRIPLFEQSVEVGGYETGSHGPMRRVTLGSGYLHESVFECFEENYQHYPVLLPELIDEPPEQFSNLRLHNGTLWRWNRPLIGIDDGKYHIRIEHRVVPAGPSVIDSIANAAFYFGLAHNLANRELQPEMQLSFGQARDNFYAAAKNGFDCNITWLEGKKLSVRQLLLDTLLPQAAKGLTDLGIKSKDINHYLGIIEKRCSNSCNGSAWQRAFVARYGNDMQALTRAYVERQNSGEAVHEWDM